MDEQTQTNTFKYFDEDENELTLQQVKEVLQKNPVEGLRLVTNLYDAELVELIETVEDDQFGAVKTKIVDQEGGYEGGGEYAMRVIELDFQDEKIYVRCIGSFNSWEGTDYDEDNVKIVVPREVTVVQYFNKE